MNTKVTINITDCDEEVIQKVKSELLRIENKLSRFFPNSDISKINQLAGNKPTKVSVETMNIISESLRFSDITNGLFDITIGPLINLWDIKYAQDIPSPRKINRILPLVNYHNLELFSLENTIKLNPNQQLDLGGIGKGYASDCLVTVLKSWRINSAYINIGGNVATVGIKSDNTPWRVGIAHPRSNNTLIGALAVSNKAVVTSGDYERFFIDKKGILRHHILNPKTGFPACSGLCSVTVISNSGMCADALSTAIFIAGIDSGLNFLSSFPDTEVVLVDQNLNVFITKGLREKFLPMSNLSVNII